MADLNPAAKAIVEAIKAKAKVIDGVPYIPTGFEGKSLPELIAIIDASYGKIEKTKVGGSSNTTSLGFIAQRSNVVIPTNVNDVPASVIDVLPNYSKEEVEAVARQAVEECEIRSITPNILNDIQLSEAIDAKCDIKIPAPALPAEFLVDTPFVPEPEDEPEDALKPPKFTLVTLISIEGLTKDGAEFATVKVIKKSGDTVSCGETIMEVGGQAVKCPVNAGILKKIITAEKAVKFSQLFLIEEPNPIDTAKQVFDEADSLKKKINEMTILKERLGIIEPKVWSQKIIAGIFEGQYQGFVAYYKQFNDIISQRDSLNNEFIANKEKLKDLLYTYTYTTTTKPKIGPNVINTNSDSFILPNNYNENKKTQIKELITRQDEISTNINSLTSQLDAIRSEQPTYFALDKSSEVEARVIATPYTKGSKGSQYTFIPFKSGGKVSSPYVNILKNLPPIIKPFTNNILLADRYFTNWSDIPNPLIPNIHFDINQKNIFSYKPLIRVETSPTDYTFNTKGGSQQWAGEMWKTRVNFFETATAVSQSIKPTDDPDTVIKKSGDLSAQERALPYTIEALATNTYTAVVNYCKNFGYYLLNDGSIFIQRGKDKTSELEKKRKESTDSFDILYAEYVNIRNAIAVIEKYIDDFPKIVKDLTTGGCVMPGAGPATVGQYEGKKTRIIPWPLSNNIASGAAAPPDNDKENGNPNPNSPPVTSLSYWKKYCKRATTVNLLPTYWPIGIIIPAPSGLIKIPFPIIWTPLAVIPSPLAVIVIGITLCGICPGPFIYVVNPGWPFPIGLVAPKESWFIVGNRGPKSIRSITTSEVASVAIPTVNVPLKYKKNDVEVKTIIKINVAPLITQLLPFTQDDLPVYERLTMTNIPYVLYLGKWCKQGKNTYGFFTS